MSESLSLAAERALAPKPAYFDHLFTALGDPWSSENPDGYILGAIAENAVSAGPLLDRLESNSQTSPAPLEILQYNDMKGLPTLRRDLCDLLERTSMHGSATAAENLALSCGLSAVLDNTIFCIADPGNACLIPAPYYPIFDADINVRNNVHTIPFYPDASDQVEHILSPAKREAEFSRRTVKAVLLTNPDNPTGAIMSEAKLLNYIKWCCNNKVHCIVDEIYALSVFDASAPPFRSAMVVAREWAETLSTKKQEQLWLYVHVLIGLSKDFCISGLRVGGLYTYNQHLLEAYDGVASLSAVSNLTQWSLSCLFADTEFIDNFIEHNATALRTNCDILTDGLDQMGVKYTKPKAGFFVWIDLGEKLGIVTFDRELEILIAMFQTSKLFFVNGQACHTEEPGMYRICFSAHSADGIHELVIRLAEFIENYKVSFAGQSWNSQAFMLQGGFGQR